MGQTKVAVLAELLSKPSVSEYNIEVLLFCALQAAP
jgi:hypothetical protein